VWNPAFDVTPAQLIRGIITEHGIIDQRDGAIDVNSFLREKGLLQATENGELRTVQRHDLLLSLKVSSAAFIMQALKQEPWHCV
jgi:hypothetical protein